MTEELRVRFTNPLGRPVPCTVMFTADERQFPFWSEWQEVAPGLWSIRYAKTEPFSICVLWEIANFGKVIVVADNEGRGFRLGMPCSQSFSLSVLDQRSARSQRRRQS